MSAAQISQLRAEAESLEALAWDKRAEAFALACNSLAADGARDYAVSCREMAAMYLHEVEKGESND